VELEDILAQEIDADALQEIADAFAGMYARLSPDIELIIRRLGDNPTPAQIKRATDEIYNLLYEALDDFSGYMTNALPKHEDTAIALGLSQALLILALFGMGDAVDGRTRAIRPAQTALQSFAGSVAFVLRPKRGGAIGGGADGISAADILGRMLAKGSPLYERLQMYGEYHAARISAALMDIIKTNIGRAEGQKLIALIMSQSELLIANALADAIRLTRTSILYAYREAARLQYIANGITQWQWFATLDDRVCMSCVAMHGTVHSVDESLQDHHNGRCAMLPIVDALPLEENGIDWFNGLSEDVQKKMLGPGRFEAWKAGKFELSAISTTYNDDVYGDMRREASLKELVK
jgi:SPP1 gp7 family putative phage head morphogenesis protein